MHMIKFGTAGFREIIGEEYTKENVQKIAQSLSNIICENKKTKKVVIIGYDKRFMSREFAIWFAEVLAGNSIKVKLHKTPTPTPQVMFGVKEEKLDYGVTITASHNPYYYNGIKICIKNGQDATNEITALVQDGANEKDLVIKTLPYNKANGNMIVEFDDTENYLKTIFSYANNKLCNNNLKVLFNPMFGVTTTCAQKLSDHFNFKTFDIINGETDPYFAHLTPAPSEAALKEMSKQIVSGGYSVGLATDADGDRLGLIDEKGQYHSCNEFMAIVYYYLIKYRKLKGDIVKNCSTSIIYDMLAKKLKYKCHTTPVGFKYISSKMDETNAIIGGESSGGLTIRGYVKTKDSMLATTLLLNAIAEMNKPVSKIIEEIRNFAGYNMVYLEGSLKIENKENTIKLFETKMPKFKPAPILIDKTDGIKYMFKDNSWAQVRFSGTEPILRYHIEAATTSKQEELKEAILSFINNN